MKEKRKHKRLSCVVPVEGKQGGGFDQTATIDLSKGGIGFLSQKPIAVNKEITIALDLAKEAVPAFVKGKVKWVRVLPEVPCYRMGISFHRVFKGSKSLFDQHLFKTV